MGYGADTMLSVEIEMPSWQRTQFNGEADEIGLKYEIDMIDEVIEATHAREFATKHKSTPRGDTL